MFETVELFCGLSFTTECKLIPARTCLRYFYEILTLHSLVTLDEGGINAPNLSSTAVTSDATATLTFMISEFLPGQLKYYHSLLFQDSFDCCQSADMKGVSTTTLLPQLHPPTQLHCHNTPFGCTSNWKCNTI